MKVFFQKFRRVKKRKLLRKSIGLVITASILRYSAINSNGINRVSPQVDYSQNIQPLKASYLDKNIDNDSQSVDLIKLKTGSGTVLVVGKHQNQTSEASKSALGIQGGDLGKSGPGPRAKAHARRNAQAGKHYSGSSLIPGANGFVPQHTYPSLSCKPRVKLAYDPFQGDGDNNQPPPENGNFDASKYKGGPSPFEEYEYKDPAVVAQNIGFNQPNRLNKSYDKHAEDCFGIVENRNKENLDIFKGDIKDLAQSADEVYKGSYRYEDPAYIFLKEIDQKMTAVIVNATDEEYITSINPTSGQMEI